MRPSFYLEKLEDFIIDRIEAFFYVRHYHFTRAGERKKSKWLKPSFQKIVDFKNSLKRKQLVNWRGDVYGFTVTSSNDMTIDGYINKHGGAYCHADGKIYTTKQGYLDAVKRSGNHIKDYK